MKSRQKEEAHSFMRMASHARFINSGSAYVLDARTRKSHEKRWQNFNPYLLAFHHIDER
jgi:hypothetical protein